MREMQIRPLFPPREDVQVGDVYWLAKVGQTDAQGYCVDSPADGDFMPLSLYVAYVSEVMKVADKHYKDRPDFPRTTPGGSTVSMSATGATIAFAPVGTGVVDGTDTLFVTGRAHRTRLVGFPDFMSVRIDRKSLGAIIPIQGAFTPFGLSMEDVEDASVSIPVAESYGIPVTAAWEALSSASHGSICKVLQAYTGTQFDKPEGATVLVNEVFYTRAIDVSIQSRSSTALGIARDRQGAGTTTVPSIPTLVTPSQSLTTNGTSSIAGLTAVAQGVAQIMQSRNNVPGVSFASEQGRSTTINMRRIFDRPVAIGYRALVLQPYVDGSGNCTLQMGSYASGAGVGLAPVASDKLKLQLK